MKTSSVPLRYTGMRVCELIKQKRREMVSGRSTYLLLVSKKSFVVVSEVYGDKILIASSMVLPLCLQR